MSANPWPNTDPATGPSRTAPSQLVVAAAAAAAPAVPAASGHRRIPSLTTNASGIADSTISFDTLATGEEPLRLSYFPRPPTSLPDVPGSPFGTPPHTPTTATPTTTTTMAAPLGRSPLSAGGRDSDDPPPYFPSPPPTTGNMSPVSSVGSGSFRSRRLPVPPAMAPLAEKSARSQTTLTSVLESPDAVPNGAPPPPTAWMPMPPPGNEWTDNRSLSSELLSTSFITDLLSEASGPESEDGHYHPHPRRPGPCSGHGKLPSDGRSFLSEITYPPPRTTQTPLPEHQPGAPALPFQGQGAAAAASTAGSGTSNAARWTLQSAAADSETDRSTGLVPIALSEGLAREYARRPPSESSHTPLRDQFSFDGSQQQPGATYPPDPSARTPSSRPSRRGRKSTSSRYPDARNSMHSTRTVRSTVSSLVSSALQHVRQPPWRRVKPLPPVPMLPNMTITQEQQLRSQDAQLPLPHLVARAGELSQMLEKGRPPHHSLQAPPLPGSPGSPGEGDAMISYKDGATPSIGVWQNSMMASSEAQLPPTQKSAETEARRRRRRRIWWIAGAVGLVVILIVIIVPVVATKKSSGKKCDGNMAGSACTLGMFLISFVTPDREKQKVTYRDNRIKPSLQMQHARARPPPHHVSSSPRTSSRSRRR
jgi:hypothetical protein